MRKNPSTIELSSELADRLVAPILDCFASDEDDEAAAAVIGLIRAVAREENAQLREMFVRDVATRIYSQTMACRDAAVAFAA